MSEHNPNEGLANMQEMLGTLEDVFNSIEDSLVNALAKVRMTLWSIKALGKSNLEKRVENLEEKVKEKKI